MIGFIRDLIEKARQSRIQKTFHRMIEVVSSCGYKISDLESDNNCLLVDLGEGLSALVTVDPQTKYIRIDSSVIFDANLVNLKTISTTSHLAMAHGCAASGIIPCGEKKIKILLVKEAILNKLPYGLIDFRKALALISNYIKYRVDQQEAPNLDLSMFQAVNLPSFNPKSLGEKKEFVYRTWQDFISEIAGTYNSDIEKEEIISELQACDEFETKNKMLLAEVGDFILDELYWYRDFIAQRGDTQYNVN